MSLDLVVGGMPRGGTTVAAKFMSLHPDIFCYAGETHLIPFMYGMFGHLPCRPDKIDLVAGYLRQQFMTAMVEMPSFSVSRGAHPGNLIFDGTSVDDLLDAVRGHLTSQLYGANLYRSTLATMGELLAKADPRQIRGEKTPSNIFAMADFADTNEVKNIVVMREPIGVLRSMRARVAGGDSYANAFEGDLEANIGMYLEYAMAARRVLNSAKGGLLVRYEDIAQNPATVLKEMFNLFGREPEMRALRFVQGTWDREIADRAPMNYRRLDVKAGFDALSPIDVWKIFSLTRELRELFGYSDEAMAEYGFEIPAKWIGVEVPSKILPLYGFHPASLRGGPWMKRRGGVIVYLEKHQLHEITLELKSKFPEQVKDEIELKVSVSGIYQAIYKISKGNQTTRVNLKVHADDMVPMGGQGGYVVIDLISSVSYCEIAHTASGLDALEISFQLASWKINKKSRKWRNRALWTLLKIR